MAVLAGATILGFGLYGAVNARYDEWLDKLKVEDEQRALGIGPTPTVLATQATELTG